MFASKLIIALAASTLTSASAINLAERMPFGAISERSTMQGWSLQSSSAQSSLVSCGKGSYCPTGLVCNAAATAEVAACCTSSDCRGEVEGSPKCADSAWNLWKGYNGNGFCCVAGEVGVYDSSSSIAGTCVASASSGQTPAVQMSTGTGSVATAAPSSATSAAPVASSTAAAVVATSSASAVVVPAVSSATATGTSTAKTSGASSSAAVNASSTSTSTTAASTGAASSMKSAGIFGAMGGLILAIAL